VVQTIGVAEIKPEPVAVLPGDCEAVEPQFAASCDKILFERETAILSQPKHTQDVEIAPEFIESVETSDLALLIEGAKENPVVLAAAAVEVAPPNPMSRAARPVLNVHPVSVASIEPVRDISGDPLVNVRAQRSWPRRLDKINALAAAENIAIARQNDRLIFLHNWVEVRRGDLVILQPK